MKRWFFLALICLVAPATPAKQGQSLLEVAKECQARAERIRGLKAGRPIRWKLSSRDQILKYVEKVVDRQYGPGELEAEGLFAKILGLIPVEIEYRSFMLDLMQEQIGGVYDPINENFLLAQWLAPAFQETIIVHEVTHALQDQAFQIDSFLDRIPGNSDAVLARSAVAEGDATLVMMIDSAEQSGSALPLETLDLDAPGVQTLLSLSAVAFPSFGRAPRAIRETLMFPYLRGLSFVMAAKRRGGWEAVNGLYRKLPESTEQILHPPRYFENPDPPTPVDFAGAAALPGQDWQLVSTDVLGEFTTWLLLDGLDEDEARRAAAGWDGDRAWAWKKGENHAWAMISIWDSARDALEFAGAAAKVLPTREAGYQPQPTDENPRMSWRADDGRLLWIERNNDWVLVVSGLLEEAVQNLRHKLLRP